MSNRYIGDKDDLAAPNLFIQWKGTDLCGDFRCICGANHHIDAMFVYGIECADCGRTYQVPTTVALREVAKGSEPCTHKAGADEQEPEARLISLRIENPPAKPGEG